MRAEMMAQVRREMSVGETARTAAGRAMVALADRAQAGAITLPLTRLGYQVDTPRQPGGGRAAARAGRVRPRGGHARRRRAAGKESLYQRLSRLSPDARRRVFLVLVGDEFKTGDGTQAWVASWPTSS